MEFLSFEELQEFTHNVEEVFHDAGEVFQDVKEHVLLSVRSHTYMVAFSLMALTSAILVFGTIYVWCFHHGRPHRTEEGDAKAKKTTPKSKKESRLKQPKLKETRTIDSPKVEVPKTETSQSEEDDVRKEEADIDQKIQSNELKSESQNGEIRMRKYSENTDASFSSPLDNPTENSGNQSPGVNNNNSPVKSRIPVFRQKSKQSW